MCAVVDADDEDTAFAMVQKFWPEAVKRSCDPRETGWMPDPARFSPRVKFEKAYQPK
jgi:hypothetical protein